MRGLLIAIAVIVVAGAAAFAALAYRPAIAPVAAADIPSYSAEQVERGKVLAAAGYCASCHGGNYAGGRGIHSEFGTIYATNITPDEATGIGAWSEAAFARAIRKGVRRDGAHLLPALPYTHFAKLTDQDVTDLYAYFRSVPAVANEVPVTKLDGIYNWRALQGGWKLLYAHGGTFRPDPSKSEAWNRGAYLAEGLGHCGACHTPRNSLGAEEAGAAYAGGLVDNWYAPAINAHPDSGLPWTAQELYTYLRTGASQLHGVAAGTMSEVVHGGLSALPDSDVQAIAEYFADLSGSPAQIAEADVAAAITPAPVEAGDAVKRGELIYTGYCVSCHFNRADDPSSFRPELAVNSAVVGPDPSNFIRVVLNGVSDPDGNPDTYMPGFARILSDRDVSDVAAFIRASSKAPAGGAWAGLEPRVAELRGVSGS